MKQYDIELSQKALMVIENICENECLGPNKHPENCIYCKIFTIAHAPSRDCKHPTWIKEVNEIFDGMCKE